MGRDKLARAQLEEEYRAQVGFVHKFDSLGPVLLALPLARLTESTSLAPPVERLV